MRLRRMTFDQNLYDPYCRYKRRLWSMDRPRMVSSPSDIPNHEHLKSAVDPQEDIYNHTVQQTGLPNAITMSLEPQSTIPYRKSLSP